MYRFVCTVNVLYVPLTECRTTAPTHEPYLMADAEISPLTATMVKIKSWLRANNITIAEGASDAALRARVKRRQIRKANNVPGHAPIRGVVSATSLSQFKETLNTMNTKNYGPKTNLMFNAKLMFIEPEITILRHSATCRGVVKNGQCATCKEQTIGEPNFYFSLMLCDLEDSNEMYNLIGYKAAGEAIFGQGKTPTAVQDLHDDAVADVLEEWSEVPINISTIVEYDIAKGKTRVSPYNLMRMPLDYLTEYN